MSPLKVVVYAYSLSFSRKLSLPTPLSRREGLLLSFHRGKRAGWGEIAPLPKVSAESLSQVREKLLRELPQIAEAPEKYLQKKLPASLRCGLEEALFTLELQSEIPLPPLSIAAWVSLADRKLWEHVRHCQERGFQTFKCKWGDLSASEGLRVLEKLAAKISPSGHLRLDSNRAFSLKEAQEILQNTSGLPIEFFEEPLCRPKELHWLLEKVETPIGLDETLRDAPLLGRKLLKLFPKRIVGILKPMLQGGLKACRNLSTLFLLPPVVSSTYESAIGIQALARFSRSISAREPAGLGTGALWARDLLPISFQEGALPLFPFSRIEPAPEMKKIAAIA